LTLLTAISAFGDSRYPYFISKNNKFEKTALKAQQLFEVHDYTIRTSPKTFIAETLFTGWIEMVLLMRINYFYQKFAYEGPVILLVDGHSRHLTPGSQRLAERTALYSLGWSQIVLTFRNRSIYAFSGFSRFSIKKKQTKGMKGETRKIYRALFSFL
jgi:hypothetical protein